MAPLPKKLKNDAIVEAIFEVRFECSEVPEVVVGRLADVDLWKAHPKQRLALSDVPGPVRSSDSQLKFQPILEMRDPSGSSVAKIGTNVVSYHVLKPYCGWQQFKPQIERLCEIIFNLFENFRVVRFGFRYVNAITKEAHHIGTIRELNTSIQVAGTTLEAPANLNYLVSAGEHHRILVRIASPEFVQASPNAPHPVEAMSALIDIDVYTPSAFTTNDVNTAKAWVEEAHEKEKVEFFKLIPEPILQKLIED